MIPKIAYSSGPEIEIVFELPPSGDNENEVNKASSRTTISSNGTEQTQFNYISKEITLNFTFITQSILDSLRTFFEDHAAKGSSFKYFVDKDSASFETYTLRDKTFSPRKLFPDGSGGFIYDIRLTMRRTL